MCRSGDGHRRRELDGDVKVFLRVSSCNTVWMKERWRLRQGGGNGERRHQEQLNCPPEVSEVCDHMEFLGEEERSEWLTGDDEWAKMVSAALFTARWRKVEILSAHWVLGEMALWRRKKMLVRIHFGCWVGLVIIEAAAMEEEGGSRVGPTG
jgi:hypothetical protein